jgi:hypothetical protein
VAVGNESPWAPPTAELDAPPPLEGAPLERLAGTIGWLKKRPVTVELFEEQLRISFDLGPPDAKEWTRAEVAATVIARPATTGAWEDQHPWGLRLPRIGVLRLDAPAAARLLLWTGAERSAIARGARRGWGWAAALLLLQLSSVFVVRYRSGHLTPIQLVFPTWVAVWTATKLLGRPLLGHLTGLTFISVMLIWGLVSTPGYNPTFLAAILFGAAVGFVRLRRMHQRMSGLLARD